MKRNKAAGNIEIRVVAAESAEEGFFGCESCVQPEKEGGNERVREDVGEESATCEYLQCTVLSLMPDEGGNGGERSSFCQYRLRTCEGGGSDPWMTFTIFRV